MKFAMLSRPILALALLVWVVPVRGAVTLSLQRTNDQVQLSWPSQGAGKVYTLQHITDFNQPHWVPLYPWDNWPIADLSHIDPIAGEMARFYRLAVTERGRVVSVVFQENFSRFQLNLLIFGIQLQYGITIPFSASYGVDVYRIDYTTLDALLGPTVASGALFIPTGIPTPADLLSYQHGTIHRRDEAPSTLDVEERVVGQLMATHGYVVAMPDYLGLGIGSSGLHPYVHRRSSATVVVDMIRATRAAITNTPSIASDVPQGLSDKLFLFGYSQGAYVTLAAQKEMQEKHAPEFHVTASAPSDGPYDLSGTMAEVITSGDPYPSPNYLPYVLLSYNEIYRLFDHPGDVMVEPYATDLPPLFDGLHTGSEIDAAMPPSLIPGEILQPAFMLGLRTDPNHPFRVVLRENDLLDWAPTNRTRLYHCASDDIVPYANSQIAYESFIAAGADTNIVQFIDPNPAGVHADCLFSGVPSIITWFDSLR